MSESESFPVETWLDQLGGPVDVPTSFLDARELPPPEPLSQTLERLPELDDETVFVQLNDREPQFLYPKLDERGYTYETMTVDDGVVTAIWPSA